MRARDFLAFYIKGSRVLAVAGMNRDREMAAAEELMRLGHMPAAHQLKEGAVSLMTLLNTLTAI